ncbi:MAG: DMT family transporter, partial [Acidimicrobiales bacterium]
MGRRTWLLFALMAVLWGVPYLFIKIAVAEVSPVIVVFVRTALAALVLSPVAVRRGAMAGLRARLGWVVVLAVVEVAGPFLLISFGEQRIPSSLSGLLIAAEPLFVAVLALRFDASERVRGLRLAGLLVGLAGVVCLLGLDVGLDPAVLVGAIMVLVATLGYAGGALIVKHRFAGVPPLGVATAMLLVTSVALLPAAVLTAPGRLPSGAVIGSLAVLGVACTAVAYLGYFALIARAGAGRAAVVTYLNPAIAVGLGVAVLGEPFTGATLAGFLLVIAGSWLSTGGRLPPRLGRGGARARRGPQPLQPGGRGPE